MKKNIFLLILLVSFLGRVNAQVIKPGAGISSKPVTWTRSDLIEPADLAAQIKSGKPVIFNMGVVNDIKGARHIGAASEEDNIEKLKKALLKVPKDASVVVYCGCCPFDRCPNIRPALKTVKDLGYTNAKLLNLKTNLKTDWIDKGFPLESDSPGK